MLKEGSSGEVLVNSFSSAQVSAQEPYFDFRLLGGLVPFHMLHTPYFSFKLSSAMVKAHGRQLWDAFWSIDSLVARRALGPEAPLTCCYEFLQVGSITAAKGHP